MLILLFHVGEQSYGVDCHYIKEIVPFIQLETVLHAETSVAGLINYYGRPVTIFDFNQIMAGKSCQQILTTRILLLSDHAEIPSCSTIGLLVEQAIEVVEVPSEVFSRVDLKADALPFIEAIATMEGSIVRLIAVDSLVQFLRRDTPQPKT